MNHYVYIITNLMNGKKYIGKRSCHCPIEDDKYMGSGKLLHMAFKKYGKENFEKKILLVCDTEEEAFDEERKAIALVDGIKNEMYYNISCGGRGLLSGESHPSYGRKMSQEEILKRIQSDPNVKPVVLLNTGEYFYSISQARTTHKVSPDNIREVCLGNRKYAGKLKDNTPMVWRYSEDYTLMSNIDIVNAINEAIEYVENMTTSNATPVVCVNTGEIFSSALKAGKVKNTNSSHIIKCCKRECDFTGYLSGERLVWRYLEDYDKNEDITEILDRGKVICLSTNEVFDTIEQARNKYNIASRGGILAVCTGERRSSGQHPITGEPLVWMYLTDYKKATKEEVADKLNVDFGRGRYRKVVCLNTKEVFNTVSDALRKYNMKSAGTAISNCCKNKIKFAGKNPETKEKLVWRYLEDYEKMTKEEIDDIVKNIEKSSDRPVICMNTGEIFEDIKIAEEKYNISKKSIIRCARGKLYTAGKHPINREGLVWMYLEDYENKYGKIDRQIS